MFTGILLVGLAVACRWLSLEYHIWNFVPAAAIALYAGSRLPRTWAWVVPMAAMVLSDVVLDFGQHRPIFELTRWTVYATLAATTLLGSVARSPKIRAWMLPGFSLFASLAFFATTNLATWAEGQLYPLTYAGLVECYVKAIPFFGNTLAADLIGTCALFGLGPLFERAAARVWPSRVGNKAKAADLSELA